MPKKPPTLADDKAELFPDMFVIERSGRDLHVYSNDDIVFLNLKSFYTPLRLFLLKKNTMRLQHHMYMASGRLAITHHAPKILRNAKKLKDGQIYYIW